MAFTDMISARAVLWWMVFTGFAINYMVRIDINIAIVSMVRARVSSSGGSVIAECARNVSTDEDYITSSDEDLNWSSASSTPQYDSNTTQSALMEDEDSKFAWNEHEQNMILGAFFASMWVTQLPGGVLAQKYGTKRVYGFSQLGSVLLAFVIPLSTRAGAWGLITMRFLQGLLSGFTWPAMHTMIGKWVPPDERSKFVSAYLGSSFGAAIVFPGCGLLISLWGWQAVFYATGVLGTLWFVAWWFLVYDSPQEHPRITVKEQTYIERSLGRAVVSKKLKIPWPAILTSVPVWVTMLAQFGQIWGLFTMLTQGPTYFKFIHGYDIRTTGILTGLPHISRLVFSLGFSVFADCLLNKKLLGRTAVRKLATFVGTILGGLCLLGLGFSGCNSLLAVIMLTGSTAIGGSVSSGPLASIVDLSPNFAGVVFGIISCFSVFPGFISPIIVGFLTFENQTSTQWQWVFLLAAAIQLSAGMLYLAYGSGELQWWNSPEQLDDPEEKSQPLVSKKRPIVKN